jgi:hypothetical protein
MLRIILNNDVFVSCFVQYKREHKEGNEKQTLPSGASYSSNQTLSKRVSSFFTWSVTSLLSIRTVRLHFRGLVFFALRLCNQRSV